MNKEFRSRNSRAERGRLRHISSSREFDPYGAFLCNRNEVSYYTKKEQRLALLLMSGHKK